MSIHPLAAMERTLGGSIKVHATAHPAREDYESDAEYQAALRSLGTWTTYVMRRQPPDA